MREVSLFRRAEDSENLLERGEELQLFVLQRELNEAILGSLPVNSQGVFFWTGLCQILKSLVAIISTSLKIACYGQANCPSPKSLTASSGKKFLPPITKAQKVPPTHLCPRVPKGATHRLHTRKRKRCHLKITHPEGAIHLLTISAPAGWVAPFDVSFWCHPP